MMICSVWTSGILKLMWDHLLALMLYFTVFEFQMISLIFPRILLWLESLMCYKMRSVLCENLLKCFESMFYNFTCFINLCDIHWAI